MMKQQNSPRIFGDKFDVSALTTKTTKFKGGKVLDKFCNTCEKNISAAKWSNHVVNVHEGVQPSFSVEKDAENDKYCDGKYYSQDSMQKVNEEDEYFQNAQEIRDRMAYEFKYSKEIEQRYMSVMQQYIQTQDTKDQTQTTKNQCKNSLMRITKDLRDIIENFHDKQRQILSGITLILMVKHLKQLDPQKEDVQELYQVLLDSLASMIKDAQD